MIRRLALTERWSCFAGIYAAAFRSQNGVPALLFQHAAQVQLPLPFAATLSKRYTKIISLSLLNR
jgi:hypothetical protein